MQCNTVNCVTEQAQLLGLELSIDWVTTDITTDTSHHTDRRVTGRVRVYLDYRGEGGWRHFVHIRCHCWELEFYCICV